MSEFTKALVSSPWYWVLLLLCIVVIVVYYKYGNKIIGWFGEHWTKSEIDKLDKNKYHVLNDIMIKVIDKTYQIDHIIVSIYGIFVIETKQYNGVITGDKYDKYWVRHIGNKKSYYINAIKQNYGHKKAISELLNIDDNKVISIVNIASNAKINIKDDGEIVKNYEILNKIFSYKDPIINNVDEIIKIINDNNITDSNIRKEHINAIKEKYVDDKSINNCPKCGNKLIEKNGKYGKFLGCSNYPNCKYTRDISKNIQYNVLEDDKQWIINNIKKFIYVFLGVILIIVCLTFFTEFAKALYINGNNLNRTKGIMLTEKQKETINLFKSAYINSKEKGFDVIHTNTCENMSKFFGTKSFRCDRLPLIINVTNNLITIYKDFNLYSLELNNDNSRIINTNKKYVGIYSEYGVAVGYLDLDETNEYCNKIGGINKIKEMATYSYTNNAFVHIYYDFSHISERGGNPYANYGMIVDMFFSSLTGKGYDLKANSTNKEETNKMCEAFYYIMK